MKEETLWKIATGEMKMSKRLALQLRNLRKEGCSWRSIASELTKGETSDQPLGMFLCEIGAKMLNEDPEGCPWNCLDCDKCKKVI